MTDTNEEPTITYVVATDESEDVFTTKQHDEAHEHACVASAEEDNVGERFVITEHTTDGVRVLGSYTDGVWRPFE